jgi:hypothetical protein
LAKTNQKVFRFLFLESKRYAPKFHTVHQRLKIMVLSKSLFNILKTPGPRKGLQRKSFWRSQKIEAESPVFGALRQKCAQIPNYK